jgi:hypothetical protein
MLFVNVSEEPVTAQLELDAASYGLTGRTVRVSLLDPDGPDQPLEAWSGQRRGLSLPPRAVLAWELR